MGIGQKIITGVAGLVGGFVNAIAGGWLAAALPCPWWPAGWAPCPRTSPTRLRCGRATSATSGALGVSDRPARTRWSVYAVAVVGAAGGCALLLLTPASAFSVVVPFLVLGASALLAAQPRLKRRLAAGGATGRAI